MLDENVTIITGGGRGIGRATASEFVDHGAEVVIADIDVETGTLTAEDLGCDFRACDVTDYEAVDALVAGVADDFGKLDVLVNNAGVGSESSIDDMSLEEWKAVISLNLDGVMYGCKAALPHLLETEGCIVNIESIYGLRGGRGAAAYSASKGGVVNFTQQVAVDFATENVRVNGVCPGFVRTPMTDDLLETDRFYEFVKSRTPMNRPAEPEEIAPMVAFLGSEAAQGISGQIFAVRNNEVFLMSQPRPVRGLHRGEGWTAETLADQLPGAFAAALTPLERSADVFSWDPV